MKMESFIYKQKINLLILTVLFISTNNLKAQPHKPCSNTSPCIINELNMEVDIYLEINADGNRIPALYDGVSTTPKSRMGSNETANYRLKDLIRNPNTPGDTRPLLKALRVIFEMDRMPVDDATQIEGIKIALGDRSLVHHRIPGIPHHFEFYKNNNTGKFEAVLHFTTPGFNAHKENLKQNIQNNVEGFDVSESFLEQLYISSVYNFFVDVDPNIKHPPGCSGC